MVHTSRAALLALGTATVLAGLSGCGTSSPEADPVSPVSRATSPAPRPTADAVEEHDVSEAQAMLAKFVAARNAVGSAGYVDWTPLSEYLSGDLRPAMIADFAEYAAAGIRDAGGTVLDGTEVAEYIPAPDGSAGTVVALDACLDRSQADLVDSAGVSYLDPDRARRYVVTYRTVEDAEALDRDGIRPPHGPRMLTARARLERAGSLLVVALLTLVAVVAVGTRAHAEPPCLKWDADLGECIIRAVDPGTTPPPPGTNPPGGGPSTPAPPRVCRYGTEVIECETSLGRWSDDRQCYFEIADPQPAPDHYSWEGRTEGVIYICMAPIPYSPGSYWTIYVWLEEPEPGPDPRELAQEAVARMALRAGELGINPPGGDGRAAIVGMPTWLWIADPDEHTVGPITRTATAGAVTVTATAELERVVWDMGEDEVTCTSPGTAWDPSRGGGESPTCQYVYARSSALQTHLAYPVTATSHWVITWAGGGETGTITMDLERSTEVRVAEIQALVTLD